jgi:amidase
VEEVQTPDIEACGAAGYRALMGEVTAMMQSDIDAYGSDTIKSIFEVYFRYFPPYEGAEQITMMAERSGFARDWSLFLDRYPLVLTPFMLTPFFAPNRDAEGEAGAVEALGAAHWSFAMNYMGLPAGNVPARLAELPNGPNPIGVQVVGRRWREDLVVDALDAIEARVGPLCETLWERMA